MTYYRRVGEVPRKRHSQFRDPSGRLYAEELVGIEGFFNESSLLYHRHTPNALVAAEPVEVPALTEVPVPPAPLLPRRFQTHDLAASGDMVAGRRLVLANRDVRISYVVAREPSPLFRDARGDELVFIEAGSATLESPYGPLPVGQGDYVVLPMGCVHRWLPAPGGELRALVIEAAGHVGIPARYLSPRGQLLETAPYHERDLRGPDELPAAAEGSAEVIVRHRDGVTRHVFAHHPFDVVGWDGCVYPYALSIYDFEPIVKRFHAPPPVLETFCGRGFVVCSFCPRPVDFDPSAVPAPYAHSSVDCDEVMFFMSGAYATRPDVRPGTVTFHPAGFTHGPAPGAAEASIAVRSHEEYAVMLDAFEPLSLGAAAGECADPEYHLGWHRPVQGEGRAQGEGT
ncbi:MAG TPA: homogentisate 1,2-dioxygenase [Acidimicrobiales bacterium]|nr:homogentisate 1,2-dioxygenase [Acidimicrobiales bacterium]